MLTPDQLAAIKEQYAYAMVASEGFDPTVLLRDTHILLAHIERLTRHNQRMSVALAQLSDSENWESILVVNEDDAYNATAWVPDNDPQQLAERALVEDG